MLKSFAHIVMLLSISGSLAACGGGQDDESLEQTLRTTAVTEQAVAVDEGNAYVGLAHAGSEAE